MVSTTMAVAGLMKYGRKAMATRALPKPARPSTRLATAMTRAHAAQSSVTASRARVLSFARYDGDCGSSTHA